jgi:hypothetical protein
MDRSAEDLFKTYDITKQLKENDFNLQNASYVFRLNFSLHNTFLLKEFLQQADIIRITAKDITLISRDRIGRSECKVWSFQIEFDFQELEDVKERFDQSFTSCDENYDTNSKKSAKKGADTIIFREFLFYNIISFIINLVMTFFLANIVISIFKYRTYKEEKMRKYTWLLRNKKEFLGKVSLSLTLGRFYEDVASAGRPQ